MPAQNVPAAEVDIDVALVRALLDEQAPELAGRSIELVTNGWDNVIFKLGDDLTVRLPRREVAATLVVTEQRWLPTLAPNLTLPVPTPLVFGRPGAGYPWHWSVCAWFDGTPASVEAPADRSKAARDLGAFVASMHRPAPDDAPRNPVRGIPLAGRAPAFEESLAMSGADVPSGVARRLRGQFDAAVSASPHSGGAVWLHGDLHPANVVVHRGRIRAVIDFGDMTAGDPAGDLLPAWMMFDRDTRREFIETAGYGDDEATVARGRGWALTLAVAILANSADHSALRSVAQRTIDGLLTDH